MKNFSKEHLKGKRLYLDVDGVFADFGKHYIEVFGYPCSQVQDSVMWDCIKSEPDFFSGIPLIEGSKEFFDQLKHLDPIFLTSCSKEDFFNIAQRKRTWIRKHLSEDHLIIPVMSGKHKYLHMHQTGDILIDDWINNVASWEEAGGYAIHHVLFHNSLNNLKIHIESLWR